jgi:hypothetical protein
VIIPAELVPLDLLTYLAIFVQLGLAVVSNAGSLCVEGADTL